MRRDDLQQLGGVELALQYVLVVSKCVDGSTGNRPMHRAHPYEVRPAVRSWWRGRSAWC